MGTKRSSKAEEAGKKKVKIDPKYNQTIYIRNLNDKINTSVVKTNLYLLCSSYGDIIDIVIKPKSKKMRGQAHVIFSDLEEAKLAHKGLQKLTFFGKELAVDFATRHSKVIRRAELEL